MPEYLAPGVYIEEVPFSSHPIEGVSTSAAGFIGVSSRAAFSAIVTSFADFLQSSPTSSSAYLSSAVRGFFDNGGRRCAIAWILSSDRVETALAALSSEAVSILCCPDEGAVPDAAVAMTAHCEQRKDRFCILQSPQPTVSDSTHQPPVRSSYAAYYHPWLSVPAPDGTTTLTVPPGGHVAGIYARTDIERGVWNAPSAVPVRGIRALSQDIDASAADLLASRGIDVLRNEPGRGVVLWTARTTSADRTHVNVRRFLIFIEQSLYRGLQWVVFEPNGAILWQTVGEAIEDFLFNLWKSGALVGQTAAEAYFVRCDRTTMTQDDIDNGRLVALIGIALVRPAEFVVVRITCQSDRGSASTAV